MRFLSRCWKAFVEFFRKKPTMLPIFDPRPSDQLSRFLTQSNHFRRTDNTVTHKAFMPPLDLKLSVFQTRDLDEPVVWALGEGGSRNLYGRATITVSAVSDTGLTLDPDNDPPRHANITGWPQKSEQKLLALKLAEKATLQLR